MSMFADHPLVYAAMVALAAALALACVTWLVSFFKHDVSIVDGVWSALILLSGVACALTLPVSGPRAPWVIGLATLWALRLAVYITWRNWGEPEDRRYQEIRARNQPHFEWKSLYLVFVLQAVLAWIVALSLLAAVSGTRAWGWLDSIGVAVVVGGLIFEAVGDWQLARFKARADSEHRVMDRGLWRYTRHPNYFGEFCVWWGFYLLALSAGGWWAIVSPLLMSVLLLKVSGVTLLEKDISGRRPAYREYVARTNAFFPGPPKS